MGQERLIVGAPEAVHVAATYVAGRGWHLQLGVRRQFEEWREAHRDVYELLSTEELLQVLEDELGGALLRPQRL